MENYGLMKKIYQYIFLKDVIKIHLVKFDSNEEYSFDIWLQNKIIKFKSIPKECFYPPNIKSCSDHLVITVKETRINYAARKFERAKQASILYHVIGIPTVQNLNMLLRINTIVNCPIKIEDVDTYEKYLDHI